MPVLVGPSYNPSMPFDLPVFLLGLIIGSFLNVCIYRVPRGMSVVSPRSACPSCGRPIPAWENIPVVSFLLQQGRCRGCGGSIGWIYPTVELLTGVLFWGLYMRFGLGLEFALNAVFFSLLIALMFIDLFERILPDVMTLGGLVFGLALAPIQHPDFLLGRGSLEWGGPWVAVYVNSLLGVVVGGGFLWLVAELYLRLRRVEGMGFGDVKMMAMVGAFLGWQYTWMTILAGSVLGAVVGGAFIYLGGRGRSYELPFGTFLAAAAMLVTLFGPTVLEWYLGLLPG